MDRVVEDLFQEFIQYCSAKDHGEILNQWNGDRTLFNACVKNDVGVAEEEIMRGCDLEKTNYSGYTYLHIAVIYNSSDVVRLLLAQKNIGVNAKDAYDCTSLHMVENLDILQQLITAGCDLNEINQNQQRPIIALLRSSAHMNLKDMCSMLCVLLEHEAVDRRELFYILGDELEQGQLIQEEFDELLALFLVHGVDVNQKFYYDIKGYPHYDSSIPSLLMFTMHMKSDIAFELIRYGADINFCNDTDSCLSLSTCYADSQLFKYMWSNCDKSYILYEKPLFLHEFLTMNQFGRYDFLESLYMILDSEFATDLIEMVTPRNLYVQLIRKFKQLDIERDERVKVIYTILTKSNRVSHNNLLSVYKNYGYDKELEAFMVVSVDISTKIPVPNPLTFLYYPDIKLDCERKLMSLLELSRDAIRGCLRHVEGEAYFKYYNEIQRMNIPQRLKDIICLKSCQYKNRG